MTARTRCCIAGGGPAGAILALLLARLGVSTALLEAKEDFDRAFRGDTVHPSTLEMLDDLGLADPLLARDHGKLRRMTLRSGTTTTATVLAEPLLAGTLTDTHLAAVQRRRKFQTRFIQGFQGVVQHELVARTLEDKPFRLPLPARIISALPLLRNLPARLIGWGIRPERVRLSPDES